MKIKIKLMVTLLFLLPITDLFYACKESCNTDTKYVNFSYGNLKLEDLGNIKKYSDVDSSEIEHYSYGIRLLISREKSSKAQVKNQTFSGFSQSAYAGKGCSPYYIYNSDASITSITITTIYDFDETQTAGSDISDYFMATNLYYKDFDDYYFYYDSYVIDDYLLYSMHNTHEVYDSNAKINDFLDDYSEIDLLLMFPSKTNNTQQFKIQITLSDDRVLEKSTLETTI
jgi:hypothetical protein